MKKVQPNQKHGRWTVLDQAPSRRTPCGSVKIFWNCRCDCGAVAEVQSMHLRHGKSSSCGCLQRDVARDLKVTHGVSDSLLYFVWTQMLQRCENPNNKAFERYGARGINVCARWHDFELFQQDTAEGYAEGLTIDRINNDGNYEPGNTRWVTNKVNCRNQTRTIKVDWGGKTVPLIDLAERYGLNPNTVYSRYRLKGWSIEASLGCAVNPQGSLLGVAA